jgi:CRP-like cAMP-binding protein
MRLRIEPSEDEILTRLLETDLFNGFSKHDLIKSGIVRQNTYVVTHLGFYNILRNHPAQYNLSILLKGCLSVITLELEEDFLDSFIIPGQIVGEQEFLGFHQADKRLVTMTEDAILFTPSRETISYLGDHHPELFYKNLAKCLIKKLRIQNDLIKLRSKRSVTSRLAALLGQFKEWDWKSLVTNRDTNSFVIEIIWTSRQLEYCLLSEMRSIVKAFQDLIRREVIEVHLFADYSVNKLPPVSSDFFKNTSWSKRQNDGLKISVINYHRLLREEIQDI